MVMGVVFIGYISVKQPTAATKWELPLPLPLRQAIRQLRQCLHALFTGDTNDRQEGIGVKSPLILLYSSDLWDLLIRLRGRFHLRGRPLGVLGDDQCFSED